MNVTEACKQDCGNGNLWVPLQLRALRGIHETKFPLRMVIGGIKYTVILIFYFSSFRRFQDYVQ
jgi:hypothetical protein